MPTPAPASAPPAPPAGLTRDQLLELYYWMRLTRSLEERLVNLYRQTKVIGGLFRSLGQEADASAAPMRWTARRGLPLARSSATWARMLVQGATPLEILRQYMAKADSPTRGPRAQHPFRRSRSRLHRPDLPPGRHGPGHGRGHPVLQDAAGAAGGAGLRGRRRDEHRRLPRGDQFRGGAAAAAGGHRGEQRLRLLHADSRSRPRSARLVDKAAAYGIPGRQADGNDVLAVYEVTRGGGGPGPRGRGRHR